MNNYINAVTLALNDAIRQPLWAITHGSNDTQIRVQTGHFCDVELDHFSENIGCHDSHRPGHHPMGASIPQSSTVLFSIAPAVGLGKISLWRARGANPPICQCNPALASAGSWQTLSLLQSPGCVVTVVTVPSVSRIGRSVEFVLTLSNTIRAGARAAPGPYRPRTAAARRRAKKAPVIRENVPMPVAITSASAQSCTSWRADEPVITDSPEAMAVRP